MVALFQLGPALTAQTDGGVDTGFGNDGYLALGGDGALTLNAVAVSESYPNLVGVGSLLPSGGPRRLAWWVADDAGTILGDFGCDSASAGGIPFAVAANGLAGMIDASGGLLVGGSVAFVGSQSQERALVARYDLTTPGCVLDTTFSGAGFEVFDDEAFCDTEDCAVVAIGEIRPTTGAVTALRKVLLLRSSGLLSSRHFLVGLDTAGNLLTSFGAGGYREVAAGGDGGFGGRVAMAIDGRGRIWVAGGVLDTTSTEPPDFDDVVYRFTADGDPDPDFGTAGRAPLDDDDAVDHLGSDLAITGDGVMVHGFYDLAAGTSIIRAQRFPPGQQAWVAVAQPELVPGFLLAQGRDHIIQVHDFLSTSGLDGFVAFRRQAEPLFGTLPLDATWSTLGRTYDPDYGGTNGDVVAGAVLWHGRPLLFGTAATDGGSDGFAVLTLDHHVFADGFEQGTPAAWSVVSP